MILKPLNALGRCEKLIAIFCRLYLYLLPNPYRSEVNNPPPTAKPAQLKNMERVMPVPVPAVFGFQLGKIKLPAHCTTRRTSSTKKKALANSLAKNKPITTAKA